MSSKIRKKKRGGRKWAREPEKPDFFVLLIFPDYSNFRMTLDVGPFDIELTKFVWYFRRVRFRWRD